jgi:hypothetical protein
MSREEEPTQPRLKVVSQQSSAQRDAGYELISLQRAVGDLAANLMRLIRGAGKPGRLLPQVHSIAEGAERYHSIAGHWPDGLTLTENLGVGPDDERLAAAGDLYAARMYAEEMIVRGALQFAASTLLHQILRGPPVDGRCSTA